MSDVPASVPAAPAPPNVPALPVSEGMIVFLIGAIQFVNILDFVMVMPLGPDFARALDIDVAKIGLIGGSYTLAASVSGIVGSFFLERFDRRKALGVAMMGLVVGTFAGGFAQGLGSLVLARIVAGCFGGPATSLSFSIIADVVPPQRRGRAMGAVMGAFSVASVVGVPAGLWLASQGTWRWPFFGVGALALVIGVSAVKALPPLRGHIEAYLASRHVVAPSIFRKPEVLGSYAMTAVAMAAGFVIIPNISAYVQENLGFPRARLEELYFFGGIATFIMSRLAGWLVDRFGSFVVGVAGSASLVVCLYFGFYREHMSIPLPVYFIGFMSAMALRNVSFNTLNTKVPSPTERARFMSFQSAVQHFAAAAGAFVSARLLTSVNGRLEGMKTVAVLSMVLTVLMPALMRFVETRVRGRASVPPTVPGAAQGA